MVLLLYVEDLSEGCIFCRDPVPDDLFGLCFLLYNRIFPRCCFRDGMRWRYRTRPCFRTLSRGEPSGRVARINRQQAFIERLDETEIAVVNGGNVFRCDGTGGANRRPELPNKEVGRA